MGGSQVLPGGSWVTCSTCPAERIRKEREDGGFWEARSSYLKQCPVPASRGESHAGMSPLRHVLSYGQASLPPVTRWAFQSSIPCGLFWGFHPHSLCTRVAHAFHCSWLRIEWGCPYTPGTPQLGPLLLNWKQLRSIEYFKRQLDLW